MEPRPSRWFWAGLAIVIVLAAVPRLLSYRFSLPYVDHPDEPNKYLAAQAWRGLYEHHEEGYYAGYPPGYLALSYVVQVVGAPLGLEGPPNTIGIMRLLAVIANLVTLTFIALTARLAAGNVAGWLAGAAWGVAPLVLEVGVYAIQDPFVYLWVSLALWLAAIALLDETRRHLAIWSVVAGLVAIIFKYPVLTAIAPGGVVGLIVLIRDWRRNWRYPAIQAALVIPVGLWLIPQTRAMQTWQPEAERAAGGVANLVNAERVLNNVYHAILPLNAAAFLIVVGLGLAAFFHARQRGLPRIRWEVIALALVVVISVPWLAGVFSEITVNRIKDALPATAAACVILGAALAQIGFIAPKPLRTAALAGLVALYALVVFVPQASADWELVEERRLPDSRVAIRLWADVNLDPGTVLVTHHNLSTFNPYWGGIQGRKWFDWWEDNTIIDRTVAEWREEFGISYVAMPLWMLEEARQTPEGRAFLAELLPLRAFVEPPPQRGPEVIFYRLWQMENPTQIRFGNGIMLAGYDQDTTRVASGESVTFRFYWNALETPPENYSMFLHLMPLEAVELLAQVDSNPAVPERLTQTWDDPGETLISPPYTLAIPPGLPPGEYRVVMGLYNYETGERLPVTDSMSGLFLGDAYEVARITVTE